MLKSHVFHFILCSFIFFILNVQARELLPPRFSANAYTGVYTVGQADWMVSLDGDRQHNLYVNPQGAYGSDQQWYGDVGLGYRWIKNEAAILGWYLFAGHTRVENSSGFWITNPGLEVMGRRWDARINAYIPMAGRSKELGIKEFDIVNTPVFSGHTEILNSVFNDANAIQQVGNGADARVGYQLFRTVPLKGYLGAYFFDIANADKVRGGAAGMEYWFDDNIRVFANYSYDNYQHSHVVGGVGISFGGVRKHWANPSLSERLMDPVERYLANLGHGSGIPSKTLLYGMGSGSSSVLASDSIAFFSQTGTPNNGGSGLTLANCTFENPCGPTDFTQAGVTTLGGLLPNTQLYFNGGTYTTNGLNLVPGQSVQSRSADYSQPAIGTARSTIISSDAISLQGNNTLKNIILLPPTPGGTGVNISGANNVITGNQIGSSSDRFQFGMQDFGNNTLINNSDIFAESAAYLREQNGGSAVIEDSVLNVERFSTPDAAGIGIIGSNFNLLINNTIIQLNNFVNDSRSVGLFIQSGSNNIITINNSSITVTAATGTAGADTATIRNNNSTIVVNGGDLNSNSNATAEIVSSDSTGSTTIQGGTVCQVNGTTVVCP